MRTPPESLGRWRCLLLVAGPGYGKSTALRSWLPAGTAYWLTGWSLADAVPAAPHRGEQGGPRWLVLDDVPQLTDEQSARLLSRAGELPGAAGLAIASRWPLGGAVSRLRGRGLLGRIGPDRLAMSADDVAALLRDEHDVWDTALAERLHEATGGWPALVRLAAENDEDLVEALAEPGSPVAEFLIEEVLAALPGPALGLLRDAAAIGPVSADLCRALGHRRAEPTLRLLADTGLVVPAGGGRHRVVPVVAAVARRGRTLPPARADAAAAWFTAHGPPLAAARALLAAGDEAACARMLTGHGERILAEGGAAGYVALVTALPERLRDDRIRLFWGDALRATGDPVGALAVFSSLTTDDTWDPGLAWRVGMVHYLRAEPIAALAAFERGDLDAGSPLDRALLLAWAASAHWMLGRPEAADYAARAHEQALAAGDDRALAAAHVALALASKLAGDPAAVIHHYDLGLRAARQAGDEVTAARILINQTHEQLARARYPQARDLAARAVRAAARGGAAGMRVVSLCNEAEALARLGRFDEAVDRYERVVPMCRRMGSRRGATALLALGDVHRRRGWREQAIAAYQEAVRDARDGGERQALVPALAGLARTLATVDGAEAVALADEAVSLASGAELIAALVARGWVAHHAGDHAEAVRLAHRAARDARGRGERAWLAETLELRAAGEPRPGDARDALREAGDIWRAAGAVIDADRVAASLAAVPGAGPEARMEGARARARLAAAGVAPTAHALPLACAQCPGPAVRVRVLGRFEVHVDDRPVPASAWQSRKARDLVRALVARRGRSVSREELVDLLWPGDDLERAAHRLSVLLSIARTVLGERALLAGEGGVALDLTQVSVDVEEFLTDVGHGCRLYERGAPDDARAVLSAAVAGYAGDPFDDEPYADWAAPLRDQAREAYLRARRTLARIGRRTGAALDHLLAILERDPYDEGAHRALVDTLVAAGRHGEARRAFDRYASAMRTIGVPGPDPALLASVTQMTYR
ncbi:BTAD domain-containing putative transcriptional regulator [Luedemannella helvata]|uniref:Bacterial transcriptional activator domain-containing protein n=1 Tax=Luedemannella helvata TaxID=349315 RepID=A0ABP4XCD8_9ACTN